MPRIVSAVANILPYVDAGRDPIVTLAGRSPQARWEVLGAGRTPPDLAWFKARGTSVEVPLVPMIVPDTGTSLVLGLVHAISAYTAGVVDIHRAECVHYILGDQIDQAPSNPGHILVWLGIAVQFGG